MVSIVCPFYNEKENLRSLYLELKKAMGRLSEPWEILFVDDGSNDGGGEELKPLLHPEEPIRLIELDRHGGQSAALYAGFQAARGEVVATLDADLQNPPEEIPRLVDLIRDCDIVAGIRQKRQDGWLKKASSRAANRIRQRVLGDHIQDIGCTLRVCRREALKVFYPIRGMHRFYLAVAEAEGFRIKQVPVEHRPRTRGRSKYGFFDRFLAGIRDLVVFRRLLKKRDRSAVKGQNRD